MITNVPDYLLRDPLIHFQDSKRFNKGVFSDTPRPAPKGTLCTSCGRLRTDFSLKPDGTQYKACDRCRTRPSQQSDRKHKKRVA